MKFKYPRISKIFIVQGGKEIEEGREGRMKSEILWECHPTFLPD